jgi:polyketide synthase 12/myxalamid-type polyketide synthase MxaB
MAARLQGRDQSRIADRGIGSIPPEAGLRTLGALLNQPEANVTVLPVRWQAFLDAFAGPVPPMLRVVAKGAAKKKDGTRAEAGEGLKARLSAAPEAERAAMLLGFVREQVAKVLGLDSGDGLDAEAPFTNLGLDSLMAVELRNAIGAAMERTLPASLVFDYPTIARLAEFMAAQLVPTGQETVAPASGEEKKWEAISDRLENLTDEQMAALLASQLAALTDDKGDR